LCESGRNERAGSGKPNGRGCGKAFVQALLWPAKNLVNARDGPPPPKGPKALNKITRPAC
jgi:hypothetical protein